MGKSKTFRLIMTGGHAKGTALATYQEIVRTRKNWEIYFLGAKHSVEGTNITTIESDLFPKLGIKYYSVYTGRVQRKFTYYTIPSLLKIPIGFIHSLILLLRIRPNIILSFGGFSSFPVVVLAKLLGIPVIIHEQTSCVGRANLYAQYFANTIAISRNSSKKFFSNKKLVLTGNPISENIVKIRPKINLKKKPTILITAGQTGSISINDVIENSLNRLLKNYQIFHQTGKLQFNKFIKLKAKLPSYLKNKYRVFATIQPDLADCYRKADIVVSRAGANTVSELIYLKIPCILIPLPIAYLNEQLENAKYAEIYGIATIIEQNELSPVKLIKTIEMIRENYKSITNRVRFKKSPDKEASYKLVEIINNFTK